MGEAQKTYCLKELTAETTAAFLGVHAGIIEDGFENSAAYLHGWLEVLKVKDHQTWLVKDASEAQKAADYLLGRLTSVPPVGTGSNQSNNRTPSSQPLGYGGMGR